MPQWQRLTCLPLVWSNLNFSTAWSDPNFSTSLSDPNFSTPWSELNSMAGNSNLRPNCRSSIVCLHGPKSTPNFNCLPQCQKPQLCAYMAQSQLPTDPFSKSSNSQDHRFEIWRHSHSSLISYLGFIMTIMIVISFAREHKIVPKVCTWTKSRIVQSPTKVNDKI